MPYMRPARPVFSQASLYFFATLLYELSVGDVGSAGPCYSLVQVLLPGTDDVHRSTVGQEGTADHETNPLEGVVSIQCVFS